MAIRQISAALRVGAASRSHLTKMIVTKEIQVSKAETEIELGKEIPPASRCGELQSLINFGQFICDMRRYLISDSWDIIMQFMKGIYFEGTVDFELDYSSQIIQPTSEISSLLKQKGRDDNEKSLINNLGFQQISSFSERG